MHILKFIKAVKCLDWKDEKSLKGIGNKISNKSSQNILWLLGNLRTILAIFISTSGHTAVTDPAASFSECMIKIYCHLYVHGNI